MLGFDVPRQSILPNFIKGLSTIGAVHLGYIKAQLDSVITMIRHNVTFQRPGIRMALPTYGALLWLLLLATVFSIKKGDVSLNLRG